MKKMKLTKLFVTLLTIILVMAVSVFHAKETVYAAETNNLGVFVVTNTWKNDEDSDGNTPYRPSSINITIIGSDGSSTPSTLTATESWTKEFRLPATDANGNPITYTVVQTDLDEYTSNASGSGLAINMIKTGRDAAPFNVNNTSGFDAVPKPTVKISPDLSIDLATKTLPDGFTFSKGRTVYTNPHDIDETSSVQEMISYTGALSVGDNPISGSIVLEWSADQNKASDIYGNKYPVRLTLSNMNIYAIAPMSKEIDVLAYNTKTGVGGQLDMQSYVASFTSNIKENVVGVRADITFEVLGVGEKQYTQVILDDIDIPDQVDFYNGIYDPVSHKDNDCFGLNWPYAESVRLNVQSSDVYINDGTTYLIYNDNAKFTSIYNTNDSSYEEHQTTIEYLAPASSYSFTWAGSDCGTTILMNTSLPSLDELTTNVVNIMTAYVKEYYYMQDDGTYAKTPDYFYSGEVTPVDPGTTVAMDDADKTPLNTKPEYYTRDTREDYTKDYEGTTDATKHSLEDPLTLKVYFAKTAYVKEYYYMNDDGTYNSEPEISSLITEVAPGTAVAMDDTDKTPESGAIGYALDTRDAYTKDYEGTTVAGTHYKNNPLELKVYFAKSAYQVEYYYQNDDGTYNDEPDSSSTVRLVAPATDVAVSDADKVPEKTDYALDTRPEYTADFTGKTEAGVDTVDDPLILKVYFKKQYRVNYHDNVGDTAFPEQKNPNLDYGTQTPGFDTDTSTEGKQIGDPYRQGYDFVGWTTEPDGTELMTTLQVHAITVTKNADYWAHWEPGKNTLYRVEYYYMRDGRYLDTPDDSVNRTGTTLDSVSVTPDDMTPRRSKYFLDKRMDARWAGIIAPDGSLVLKVYFAQEDEPSRYAPPATGVK